MQISIWVAENELDDLLKIINSLEKDEQIEEGIFIPEYSLAQSRGDANVLISYNSYIRLSDLY